MTGSLSDYLENELLDHVFGGGDFARPATVYVAAFLVAPGDTGGGTEVSGNAYGRVAVTNNATNFPAAASGAKTNGTDIVFPMATPSNWGDIVAYGLFDASSGGNLLGYDPNPTPVTVNLNDTLRIPAGALDITLT